jgi:hypothetical protein
LIFAAAAAAAVLLSEMLLLLHLLVFDEPCAPLALPMPVYAWGLPSSFPLGISEIVSCDH